MAVAEEYLKKKRNVPGFRVRAYKPALAHFRETRRRIGTAAWLHAARSRFHDVVPAHEIGVPVAWINRAREEPHGDPAPDREFPSLAELADWLA